MKKTLALLLTLLLLTLAFVSCNIDGTTGIFRELAQSKAPLSIRYEQLLGNDATYLYFRTAKGVERVTTAKVNSPVATSSYENIIQAASYLKAPVEKVFYITNNEVERSTNKINVITTTTPISEELDITVTNAQTTSITSYLSVKNLFANSMVLVTGKNGGPTVFELLKYDTGTNTFLKTSYGEFNSVPDGYDVDAVIQQTGKEQDATAPLIVSFVNGTGAREHYFVDPSGPSQSPLGTEKVQIANFVHKDLNNIYVLTTDGKIYHVDSATKIWTSIGSSSKSYDTNAFALAVMDGTDYHLITKPASKSSPLHVFTFPNTLPNASIGSGVDVKSGYAKELSLATIVSAQIKTSSTALVTDLLVATEENGMYDISITHADANKDIDGNGSSSGSEDYSFP